MIGSLLTFVSEEIVHRYVGSFGSVHGHSHGHGHDHHHHHHSETKDKEGSQANSPIVSPKETNSDEEGKPKAMDVETGNAGILHKSAQHDYYSELYVLLFGLSFHSLFIGIALGVVTDDWGLFAAIVFHQFFEGMALGARVARANFRNRVHIWLLDIVYL